MAEDEGGFLRYPAKIPKQQSGMTRSTFDPSLTFNPSIKAIYEVLLLQLPVVLSTRVVLNHGPTIGHVESHLLPEPPPLKRDGTEKL